MIHNYTAFIITTMTKKNRFLDKSRKMFPSSCDSVGALSALQIVNIQKKIIFATGNN